MMSELNYEHQINNSYIFFEAQNSIEEHALKMMCYHKIKHLLPLKEKIVNDFTYLYYDITNLNNLFEYAKINTLEYTLIKALMKSLFEILDISREFFLSEECFLINEKTLFFDSNSKSIYFLYLPFSTRPYDFRQQLHTLLVKLIQIVNKQDEKAISLIYKLRIIIEEQNMGITAFKELMENEDEIINPIDMKDENISVNEIAYKNKINVNKKKSKNILVLMLSQIMLLSVVFIICNKLVVPEINMKFMWIKLIMLLTTAGLLEFIIISRLLMQSAECEKVEGVIRFIQGINKVKNIIKFKKENKDVYVNKWNWKENMENKLIKEEDKKKRAYLICDDGIKTPIIKTPFIIGKTKEAVDLCIQNNLISRFHCQIISMENQYYLMDLDSCNGTFINDILVEGKKKYSLRDGDLIRIGFCTYSFSII